jgi:SchA/CurD like domain
MPNYFAMTWKVRPGTEDKVIELFENYGRPEHTITDEDGNVKGKLLSTTVWMKDNTIVRVIEFDGSIIDVAPHMGRQQAIRELEDALDQYIETPRDMSTPEGARKFFMESAMRPLAVRRWDDPE